MYEPDSGKRGCLHGDCGPDAAGGFCRHWAAAAQEQTLTEIAVPFAVTLSAVSQHLRVLLAANLVRVRRVGRERRYRLNAAPLEEVATWLEEYERFWDTKIDALGDYLNAQATAAASETDLSVTDSGHAVERIVHLPHPPHRVWRALTERTALSHWLLPASDDIRPTPGHAFTLRAARGEPIACRVVAATPDHYLRYSWQPEGQPFPSHVEWTLHPTEDGAGTWLHLRHDAPGLPTGGLLRLSAHLCGVGNGLSAPWHSRNRPRRRRPQHVRLTAPVVRRGMSTRTEPSPYVSIL